MKSLTPEQTNRRLGWPAARRSLKKAATFGAPRLRPFAQSGLLVWLKGWLCWPLRTIKYWLNLRKHKKANSDYIKLAEQGEASREIFTQTKRKMHLTEDEIFEQGNRRHTVWRVANPPFGLPWGPYCWTRKDAVKQWLSIVLFSRKK
jgi:hypothetical protein